MPTEGDHRLSTERPGWVEGPEKAGQIILDFLSSAGSTDHFLAATSASLDRRDGMPPGNNLGPPLRP